MNIDRILDDVQEYGKSRSKIYVAVRFIGYTNDELITLYKQFDKAPEWISYHLHDGSSIEDLTGFITDYPNFNFNIRERRVSFTQARYNLTLEKAPFVDLNVLYSL